MLHLLKLYHHGCCFLKRFIDFDIGAEVSVMTDSILYHHSCHLILRVLTHIKLYDISDSYLTVWCFVLWHQCHDAE